VEPLTPPEARVLGCLIEKEAAVPDTYPLTRNSLRQACNQSSSRDPIVSFDDLTVQRSLDSLKARGLVRFVHPVSGERATKFRHVADEQFDLGPPELAVVGVLVLRGPQTSGELRSRTDRLHPFRSPEEVEAVLAALAAREEPLAVELPRQPGQHGQRWAHLLCGPIDHDALAAFVPQRAHSGSTHPAAHDRVAALEIEVASLRARLTRLEEELGFEDER
jgi:uncharacterized protein YceH (UPF0502 family)